MVIQGCIFQPDFTPLAGKAFMRNPALLITCNLNSDVTIETTSLEKLMNDCWNGKLEAVKDSAPSVLVAVKAHGIHDPILTALLVIAVTQKVFPLVSYLLSLTPNPHSLLAPFPSPICMAASSSPQSQVWALLLDNGLASSIHRARGSPASVLAGSVFHEKSNQIELFDVLFAHGLHISDQLFNSAASTVGEDTMRYLVTKCQPEYMDATGALHAAAGSNGRVVGILVDAGMDVNYHRVPAPSFDNHMWPSSTALHLAASKGDMRTVKVLLEKGADKTVKNTWRQTAEDAAMAEGHGEVAEIIRIWGGGSGSKDN
jgi:Ankyrin repeats (3 copies)